MKIASLAELKKELAFCSDKELTDLILDLAKFSKDNKTYLFFKLFERENPRLFIDMVQEELEMEFAKANTKHYHYAKKSAQGIRRKLNKNLKLTKDKATQIELIVFFCKNLKLYGYLDFRHPVIDNLYKTQIGKAERIISTLHEDLQYDFKSALEDL